MKRENFYRRDPSKALSGMIGLSLEERGVYNTVLDLLYSTWRPLEDDRAFIANWCGCAVQKLNPIIRRLLDKGRLITFDEGGRVYLSDEAFEAERATVKGALPTRSGRGQIGEKSGEVGEKSAGVEENPPSCQDEVQQNQPVKALEKTREEKSIPPKPPEGAEVLVLVSAEPLPDLIRQAFDLWNETAKRCGLSKAEDLTEKRRKAIGKRLEGGGLDRWRRALDAVEHSKFCRGLVPDRPWRAGLDFVASPSGFQKLVEGNYARDARPPTTLVPAGPTDPLDRWRRPMRSLKASGYWNTTDDGPRPGKPGCEVPAAVLVEFGFPAQEAAILPFDQPTRRTA